MQLSFRKLNRESLIIVTQKHIFIFGLGYVGTALADRLAAEGWHITGTTRDPSAHKRAGKAQWTLLPFTSTGTIDGLDSHLQTCNAILSTIAPQEKQDPVLRYHREILERWSDQTSVWSGYISATSVYADEIDDWVDENTPPAPATERGRVRVATELDWQNSTNAEILRVAGIYGPGRSAFTALRENRARIIDKSDHLFNRIHLDDIVGGILAAMATSKPRRIVNLTDKEPAKQGDVVRYAADLLGMAPPPTIPYEEADLTPMARSFYKSRRKLRSVRLEPELGYRLKYPNYRKGLEAVLKADQNAETK